LYMETKIVKITSKGQISIPIEIRNSIGISSGDDVFMIGGKDSVLIKKINKGNFEDLLKNSESVANKLWNNKEDDIWDTV